MMFNYPEWQSNLVSQHENSTNKAVNENLTLTWMGNLLIADFFAKQNTGGAKERVVLLWLGGDI